MIVQVKVACPHCKAVHEIPRDTAVASEDKIINCMESKCRKGFAIRTELLIKTHIFKIEANDQKEPGQHDNAN